jgi:3-hydroxybutyryl-CoA dehydrogenase
MALDTRRSDLTLGIVGAGLMGRGIAQIAAQAGVNVKLYDVRTESSRDAKKSIEKTLSRLAEKGKISAAEVDAASRRIQVVESLEALAPSHIVVEAVLENLDAKRSLFQSLEAIVEEPCLLATNTSSLSVTAIAAACRLPGRVAGFHFFSPVPLMKIVEVIDGVLTESWVGEALTELAKRMGHTPVRAKDTPGFIVNHAGRGFGTEALRIVGEGIAEFQEVDRILREVVGFRMGPFELMDLTGLDVSHPVMESIYDQYYQEPRFRPSPITRQRLAAGLLGRKTGRGFYTYKENGAEPVPAATVPDTRATRVWVSRANPSGHATVSELLKDSGARIDEAAPTPDSLCIVTPLGEDATTAALAENLDPVRTVAIDTLYGVAKHRTLMTTPVTSRELRDAAHGLFASDGAPVTVIHDSPGFVVQRVVASIVNIGCDIAQQRIASPQDIDRAVTLGLGYPKGPLGMGDAVGAAKILAILDAMLAFYGDPRYRASPWLKRRARLGVSLLNPDNQDRGS